MLCDRSDRDDSELFELVRSGCLLSLHLSGRSRSAKGSRTARFYVDDVECAVFTNIPHDGGKLRTLCRAGSCWTVASKLLYLLCWLLCALDSALCALEAQP